MLSPDQLQDAGDAVAAIYSDMEARMLDHLVGAMLNGSPLTQRTTTELNLLAQSQTSALRQIVEENRTAISDAVYETAEQLLAASDKDDARRLGSAEVTFPVQLAATTVGMQLVLDRDNLDMIEGAKRAFLACSLEAVTKANSGLYTADQALHSAVRKLEREGISVISYRNAQTGVQTVQNKVDVAVRRHVRTQIAQDGARMTLGRMEGMSVALVEVSSHPGSRPTHQAWEGRVYSLKGDIEIDGARYPDFYSATDYGSVDGLLGANCRHSFGPYLHGAKRAYEPDPEHPSGLPNDEIYQLTQKQRHMERQIRAAKRELRGAQQLYEHEPSLSNRTSLLKSQERLKARQDGMRDLIKEANARCKPGTSVLHRNRSREWAGDMPAKAKVSASNRKLDAFLDSRSKQLKAAGISKARMRAALSGEMARRGGTAKDFASLGAGEQQSIFSKLIGSIDAKLPSTKKANAGKHSVASTAKRYEAALQGKGLGVVHEKAIAKVMSEIAHPKVAAFAERHLPALRFDSLDCFSANQYSPQTRSISLRLDDTAAGFACRSDKAPYQSLFHEAGHLFDDLVGGFKIGERRYDGKLYGLPDGIACQMGMADAVRKDMDAWISRVRKGGAANEIVVHEAISREINRLPESTRGGISDIVSGATKGMAGKGHSEIYWEKRGDYGLATEAFAHFFESAMANPAEFEALKAHFPNAYEVFMKAIAR